MLSDTDVFELIEWSNNGVCTLQAVTFVCDILKRLMCFSIHSFLVGNRSEDI